jgi:putative ABC transport system permease protein
MREVDPRDRVPRRYLGALLLFYPRGFRERYGAAILEGLCEMYEEARPDAGVRRRLSLGFSAFVDSAGQGLRERVSGLGRWVRTGRTIRGASAHAHGGRGNSPMSPGPRPPFESIIRDTRHALRALLKRPGFTGVTVLTLGIAIGANAAIFTLVHRVLIRPLPFPDQDRIVTLWHMAPGLRPDEINQSPATYFLYRDGNRVFDDIALWDNGSATITGSGEPQRVQAMMVTASYLPVLGLPMEAGRGFVDADDTPGAPNTVVLTYDYWQNRLGRDPRVVGSTLRLDGEPTEVIGILGRDFPMRMFQVLRPARLDRTTALSGDFSYQVIARLGPDVTMDDARADLARLLPDLPTRFAGSITPAVFEQARFAPVVRPVREDLVGDLKGPLWVVFGAVAMILLIAAANVANLFLARAEGRQCEVALRTALGAGRRAVVRFFLIESVVLGLMGGALGLVVAWGAIRALLALSPSTVELVPDLGLNATVMIFTFGVSVLTGAVMGVLPLARYGKPDVMGALKGGGGAPGRGANHRPTRTGLRGALVITQMGLALVLLVGSGLMLRSYQAMKLVDPGFEAPEELVTVRVSLPPVSGRTPDETAGTHVRIQAALAALPGVTSAGASSSVTMDGRDSHNSIYVEDFMPDAGAQPPMFRVKDIMPGYTETMGIRLVAGRTLRDADLQDRARRVVVSEGFAATFWPDAPSAVGRRIGFQPGQWWEIVGVVGAVHDDGMDRPAVAMTYFPMTGIGANGQAYARRTLTHVVRSPRGGDLVPEVRAAVWAVDPELPLTLSTQAETVERTLVRTTFTMGMLGLSAAIALLLGAVGIYGVISYLVSQRTREIGVRMALGASSAGVSRMVVRQGLVLAVWGVAIGVVAAVGVTRVLASLLFGVSELDPVTFVAVAIGLLAVAAVASWVPARRAARVEPGVALRWE